LRRGPSFVRSGMVDAVRHAPVRASTFARYSLCVCACSDKARDVAVREQALPAGPCRPASVVPSRAACAAKVRGVRACGMSCTARLARRLRARGDGAMVCALPSHRRRRRSDESILNAAICRTSPVTRRSEMSHSEGMLMRQMPAQAAGHALDMLPAWLLPIEMG